MYPFSLNTAVLASVSSWAAEYKEYLKNVDWTQTATVVIAGVFIVLAVLIVLIGIFIGFGTAVSKSENAAKGHKKDKKPAVQQPVAPPKAEVPVQKAVHKAPAAQEGISGEVVAAITAAVTASEGGQTVVIRSIRKKNVSGRNPWAAAAISDNTRSF